MHKNPIAFLDFVSFFYEREGRETLEESSGCDTGLQGRWDGVCFCCGSATVFRVGGGAEPDNTVTRFEVVELTRAGGYDCSFCFAAEDFGFGRGVEAGAEIAVEFTVSGCFG